MSPPLSCRLLGALLASCTCSATSKPPHLEGAGPHLPDPRAPEGVLSTSWFREFEAQPPALSPLKGLRGLSHTSQEVLHTEDSSVIRDVSAQNSESHTEVLDAVRSHRTEVKSEWGLWGGPQFSEIRFVTPLGANRASLRWCSSPLC